MFWIVGQSDLLISFCHIGCRHAGVFLVYVRYEGSCFLFIVPGVRVIEGREARVLEEIHHIILQRGVDRVTLVIESVGLHMLL